MSPREIYENISNLFNGEGIVVKGFKITSKTPTVATVRYDNEIAHITFGENQPKAEITKIITIYAYIEKIVFGPEGGSIKLRNFPDFSFSYAEELSTTCATFDNSDICNEIEVKYCKNLTKILLKSACNIQKNGLQCLCVMV